MDVHSGYPFWLVKNGLLADYPALEKDLSDEDVVIIGSGISGALAAHQLCSAGFKCTIIDKRIAGSGSSWASTAHVNYELDTSLQDLTDLYNEDVAVAIYKASLDSVNRIKEIAKEIGNPNLTEPKPSLYLASDKQGAKEMQKEFILRKKHNLPVELLDEAQIQKDYGSKRKCALHHTHAVQLDSYKMTIALIEHNIKKGALRIYTRTEIKKLKAEKEGVTLLTADGFKIKARHVVCAPGFESAQFLPKKVMDLNSTYALVTQPLPAGVLWKDTALIWETKRPYFYLRTTADNRIMMGGEDVWFKNPEARDSLLEKKKDALLRACKELFPHLNITADFYWCGTFGETKDGLPHIGLYPGIPNVYFALGYGGNGTSYSVIASEVICNLLLEKPDDRTQLFSFTRKHAK